MMDAVSVLTHHDAITGNNIQYVDEDYRNRTVIPIRAGYKIYSKSIADQMQRQIGIQVSEGNDLSRCMSSHNNTESACPIFDKKNDNKKEFILVVHNGES